MITVYELLQDLCQQAAIRTSSIGNMKQLFSIIVAILAISNITYYLSLLTSVVTKTTKMTSNNILGSLYSVMEVVPATSRRIIAADTAMPFQGK